MATNTHCVSTLSVCLHSPPHATALDGALLGGQTKPDWGLKLPKDYKIKREKGCFEGNAELHEFKVPVLVTNLRHNTGNYQSAQTSGGSRLSGPRVWTASAAPQVCFRLEKLSDLWLLPIAMCPHFRERPGEAFLLVFNGVSLGEGGTFVSLTTLPLEQTMSPLTPHASTTAPGTGGPVGPFSPPLEQLLLQEDARRAKTRHVSGERRE